MTRPPSHTFPWTEPIRLTFTSLDPMNTSVIPSGDPSPSLSFRSSAFNSSSNNEHASEGQESTRLSIASRVPEAGPIAPLYTVSTSRAQGRTRGIRLDDIQQSTTIQRGESGDVIATLEWGRFRRVSVNLSLGEESNAARVDVEGLWEGTGMPWYRRSFTTRRTVTFEDSRGRRYSWRSSNLAQRPEIKEFALHLITVRDHVPEGRVAGPPDGERVATLVFDATDDSDPTSLQAPLFRLDRGLLDLRLREHCQRLVQELQDLCVISAILLTSRERNNLFDVGFEGRQSGGTERGRTRRSIRRLSFSGVRSVLPAGRE